MPDTYLCADCGATYDEKDPPCLQCASERFAILETTDRIPERIEGAIDLAWRCTGCGTTHVRNNPPCGGCGTMEYEAVYDDTGQGVPVDAGSDAAGVSVGTRRITGVTIVAYLYGVLAVLLMVGYLTTSVWGAAALGLSGLVAMPVVRRWANKQFGVEFSTGAVWLLIGLLLTAWYVLVV